MSIYKGNPTQVLLSIFYSLAIGGILIVLLGYNPFEVCVEAIRSTLGSIHKISELLVVATPLILISVGYTISFRTSWNIGAEGQYVVGAIAATFVSLHLVKDQPTLVAISTIALASILTGASYVSVAAWLKLRWNLNVVFPTLMLNFISVRVAQYLYSGPWKDPSGGFPRTERFPANTTLPSLWPGTRLHIGFVIALVVAIAVYVILRRTTWGYEIGACSLNPHAARYGGINVKRVTFLSMAIAGASAGLAGAMQVSGITHRLVPGVAAGYGNIAIIIAWLSGLHPLITIPVAVAVATLILGGENLQITHGIPHEFGEILGYTIMYGVVIIGNELTKRSLKKE